MNSFTLSKQKILSTDLVKRLLSNLASVKRIEQSDTSNRQSRAIFTRHWMNSILHWSHRNLRRHWELHYMILMLKKVVE